MAAARARGNDLTVTVGKFFTNPEQHAFSKIAGEVGLCIDVRSHEKQTLAVVKSFTDDLAQTSVKNTESGLSSAYLPGASLRSWTPECLRPSTIRRRQLDIPHIRMASGAGHDAAVFAGAGGARPDGLRAQPEWKSQSGRGDAAGGFRRCRASDRARHREPRLSFSYRRERSK